MSKLMRTELKSKVERNIVAIVGEKGIALAHGKNMSEYFYSDSVVDATLNALIAVLETVPDNKDEIVKAPYRIVLPKVISGVATGSFIDYIRTGKSVTTGESMSKVRLEAYAKVMKLMSSKYANVELVADRHMSDVDKKAVKPAWACLKAKTTGIIRETAMSNCSEPISKEEKVETLKVKLAEAIINGNDEEAEKIKSALARLSSNVSDSKYVKSMF